MKEKSVKMVGINSWVNDFEAGINYLPHFQSGDRWDDKRRIAFIKSVLAGLPIPAVYLTEKCEIVDGQQRTKALSKAIAGSLGFSVAQIATLKEFKIRVITLSDYTQTELKNWYISINNGGVSHNKMEIAKASLSEDDSIGFTELENSPLWSKLPVKSDREGIKSVIAQALGLIISDTGAVDMGGAQQERIFAGIANNPKAFYKPLTKLVDAVDYCDKALKHPQKWAKKGMIAFILALAVEANEQADSPALFGGFLQGFFTGKLTVMTGKKHNIPTVSSEYWSLLTKGAGTSKPDAVKIRWDYIFSTYSEKIGEVSEYETPAYILEATKEADKKAQQEKDRQLYAEFTAWKQAQEIEVK
jgi:hypothetical protein